MGNRIEYAVGQRIGTTRLSYQGDVARDNPRVRKARFTCDCGNTVEVPIAWVVHNNTTSCGCFRKEMVTKKNTTHGHAVRNATSGAYRTWQAMHQRCKSDPHYTNVSICSRWYDFENFLADMGDRPDGMTIERKDNNGDYTPQNCVWASWTTQANNSRNTVRVTIGNETHSINEWCRIKGIKYYLVKQRRKAGMSLEEAICKPIDLSKSNNLKGGDHG